MSEDVTPEQTARETTVEEPGAEQRAAGTRLKSAARIAAFDVVGPLSLTPYCGRPGCRQ